MKIALIAALAALGLGAAAFAGVGRPDGAHGTPTATTTAQSPEEITVTATGTVTHVPDTAQLSFSVSNEAATAQEAMAENSKRTGKVIDALKSAGVDAKDIQTQDVSLDPHYPDNSTTIDGYTASNSVNVSTSIARAGSLVDTGVTAGANGVSGPSLSISDQDALYRDALADAVKTGRLKAEAIAKAAGVTVGRVTNVQESVDSSGPVPYAAAVAARDMATPAPVEPGTQDVTATVTMTFAIG